jgi:hypothetical protein
MKGITGVPMCVTYLHFSESFQSDKRPVKKKCPLKFQIHTKKLLG